MAAATVALEGGRGRGLGAAGPSRPTPPGRPYYERIEPLVALFPELDGKIDAREDDFPKKAKDPTWTGFHPIERALWKDGRITPRTRVLAAGLVGDSRTPRRRMDDAKVTPEVVIPGTAELVDEIEESKITGEEERYSKLDLPTFVANLEGAREFFNALAPLVAGQGRRDSRTRSTTRSQAAFDEVGKLRKGDGLPALQPADLRPAAGGQADHRGAGRAAGPRAGDARRPVREAGRERRLPQAFRPGRGGGRRCGGRAPFGASRLLDGDDAGARSSFPGRAPARPASSPRARPTGWWPRSTW